jgi:hypothetical protein
VIPHQNHEDLFSPTELQWGIVDLIVLYFLEDSEKPQMLAEQISLIIV